MNYVNIACKEGVKPEEVQSLFNDIYNKSNTKPGMRVLRLFSKGIVKAKKKSLLKQQQSQVQMQPQIQPQKSVERSYQYFYKQ